jgi:hypothetical protein
MEGNLYADWKSFDHPQLGPVEIGGCLSKNYDSGPASYINVMCLPGPDYERLLANHTKWHLYLVMQSPLVRIVEADVSALDGGYYRIEVLIGNEGFLPTYGTEQALLSKTAKTVEVRLSLEGAELVGGEAVVDLGHLPGHSAAGRAEWVVKGDSGSRAIIEAISQKGGVHTRELELSQHP